MIIKLANDLEKEANVIAKNWQRMKNVKANKGLLTESKKRLKVHRNVLENATIQMDVRAGKLEEAMGELERAQHARKDIIQSYLDDVRSPLEAARKGNAALEKGYIKSLHKDLIEVSRNWQKVIQKHDANVTANKREVEKYKDIFEKTKKTFAEEEKKYKHRKREVRIGQGLRIGAGVGGAAGLGGTAVGVKKMRESRGTVNDY